jgi:hypothetical protein
MRSSVDLPQPDGPTNTMKFAVVNCNIDAMEHMHLCVGLAQADNLDLGHQRLPSLILNNL